MVTIYDVTRFKRLIDEVLYTYNNLDLEKRLYDVYNTTSKTAPGRVEGESCSRFHGLWNKDIIHNYFLMQKFISLERTIGLDGYILARGITKLKDDNDFILPRKHVMNTSLVADFFIIFISDHNTINIENESYNVDSFRAVRFSVDYERSVFNKNVISKMWIVYLIPRWFKFNETGGVYVLDIQNHCYLQEAPSSAEAE